MEFLQSEAQELFVIDPEVDSNNLSLIPLEVIDPETVHQHSHDSSLEVEECDLNGKPLEIEIVVSELPGAPDGTPDPIEVKSDDSIEVKENEKSENDTNDASNGKKIKWDWESKGTGEFITWVKERIQDVPKHSGQDLAGLERAYSYLEKLDSEISKAMRMDLDGELDANQIEKVRAQLDDGLSRLSDRIDKVKKHQKSKRKKKSEQEEFGLIKEAQKIVGIKGTYITVPLLISGIARVCINGMVSAGHDIEQIYHDQVEKYKLNDREKAEVRWLLFDMGYGFRGDRGFMPEDKVDYADGKYDYSSNYLG